MAFGFVLHHKETGPFCGLADGKSAVRKHPLCASQTLLRSPITVVSPSRANNETPIMPAEGGQGIGVW